MKIHPYGVIIAIAILVGVLIAKKRAKLYGINPIIFDSPLMLLPLVLGVAGGRLYHVIDYWNVYSKDLPSIFAVWQGGLGIYGAIVGIFVGFWLVAKRLNIQPLKFLDLIAPSVLLGQAIGRIGNYINKEGYGPPTNLPWGIQINGIKVHPTFFYEAILDLLFFFLLLKLSRQHKRPGQTFGLYLMLYGLGRFAVEFLRTDTWTIGGIRLAWALSVITVAIGFWLFRRKSLG